MRPKHFYYEQLLSQFEPLLGKTLSRLGLRPNHIHYEDFFQELRLKLIKLADQFDGQPLGDDRYRFTAYAGQGLYWHLIDLLRKQNQIKEEAFEHFNEFIDRLPCPNASYTSVSHLNKFFTQAKNILTDEEYRLLWLLFDEEITVVEIAKLLSLSRKTIYDHRKKIQRKLSNLKYLLQP